jgi:hypothetical protein
MESKRYYLTSGVLTFILFSLDLVVIYTVAKPAYDEGLLWLSRRIMGFVVLFSLAALAELALWVGSFFFPEYLDTILNKTLSRVQRLRWGNILTFIIILFGFAFLIMGPYGRLFITPLIRIALYTQVVMVVLIPLKAYTSTWSWKKMLVVSALGTAYCLRVVAFFPEISADPFSIGWSEGSQYYNASLFFARRIYGMVLSWPVLNPSKYLLQSIPFLIPNSPIWLHRLWESILWICMPWLASWLLARRFHIKERYNRWLFIIWVNLFLLIGAIYYHLLLCVILVFWGFRPVRTSKIDFFLSLSAVFVSSIWAGISRVNWFPVPGMMASAIYFLETSQDNKQLLFYILKGLSWSIFGGLVALATYGVYIINSGNPPVEFTSSFTAELLWYRLLPNPTFTWGILPSIIFVTLPLAFLSIFHSKERRVHYIPLRLVLLVGLSLVLLLGGLVASTKIGAGSNLHNLDGYMIIILIIASYIYHGKIVPDHPYASNPDIIVGNQWFNHRSLWLDTATIYTLIVPIIFGLMAVGPIKLPPRKVINSGLAAIQKYVTATISEGGEVIFITERQLLTFHSIYNVPLVPEYEKFYLMEMAMAGNSEYMDKFFEDIQKKRFGMIITEPVNTTVHKDYGRFGEENWIWRKFVNKVLFCYYKPIESIKSIGVEILVPRIKNKCAWPKIDH